MSLIIRVLALLTGCITAGWAQSTPANLQREIASRYLDWSQANAVLVEAVRRLEPCSPRIASLLTEARDTAAAMAKVNRQYFDQYTASMREDLAAAQKAASESEIAFNELKLLEDPARQYGVRVDSMRRRIDSEGAAAPPVDSVIDGSSPAELGQLRTALAQRQTLVQQIASGAESEYKLWMVYYNSIATAARLRCGGVQPGAAKRPAGRVRP